MRTTKSGRCSCGPAGLHDASCGGMHVRKFEPQVFLRHGGGLRPASLATVNRLFSEARCRIMLMSDDRERNAVKGTYLALEIGIIDALGREGGARWCDFPAGRGGLRQR